MTLARLLRWHYFSVQDSATPKINADRSIDRWSTAPITKWNLNGHRQRVRKDREFAEYAIKEYEGDHILFYDGDFLFQKWHRVLMNLNPRRKLTQDIVDCHSKVNPTIFILEFCGYAHMVEHPKIKYGAVVLKEMQWFKQNE